MFDYRKITGTRDLRKRILSSLSWVPDKLMLRIQYFLQTGEKLHLKHPKKFNEFIQCYKLNYHDPEMFRCVDKLEVRNVVKEKGLEDTLVPLYKVYDKAEDIKPEELPEKFVIKASDGGGGNEVLICREKTEEKISEILSKSKEWMHFKRPKKHIGREWAYQNDLPRKIIVEKLLENPDGSKDIDDFKFFCYDGKFRVLEWHKDRSTAHSAAHYDENLHYLPDFYTYAVMHKDHPLPDNIKEMVEIAEKLSEGFPFVRVDLYNVAGKIYFGELTFYPASGYFVFRPNDVNTWLGSFFNYPFKQISVS